MRCEDIPGLLPFHVEGALPKGEAAELASHLASCPSCQGLEADARTCAQAIRDLPTPPCPARRAPAALRVRRLWMPAAATLLLAMGTGLWTLARDPGIEPLPAPQSPATVRATLALPGMQAAMAGGLVLGLPGGREGPRTAYTTLGSGALSPGSWQVFRVRRQAGRLEIFADSRRLVSTEADAQGRMAAGYPAAGLMVWQGPVEVRRLRWRALGAR